MGLFDALVAMAATFVVGVTIGWVLGFITGAR